MELPVSHAEARLLQSCHGPQIHTKSFSWEQNLILNTATKHTYILFCLFGLYLGFFLFCSSSNLLHLCLVRMATLTGTDLLCYLEFQRLLQLLIDE